MRYHVLQYQVRTLKNYGIVFLNEFEFVCTSTIIVLIYFLVEIPIELLKTGSYGQSVRNTVTY